MSIYEASSKQNAFRHPLASLSFAMGNKSSLHQTIIIDSAKYLLGSNTDIKPWKKALTEIEANDFIAPNPNPGNIIVGNNLNTTFGKWIYCCVRVMQPEVMIETGVAHGASSWMILNAIRKNGKGKLYSIDLPGNDTNPDYNFESTSPHTGWMVPGELKKNWELHLGYAQELLPRLIERVGVLDLFFHDSDHSYLHMKYEFETAVSAIRNGGLLLSDDVHKNKAFEEFTSSRSLKALQFNKGGCALIA